MKTTEISKDLIGKRCECIFTGMMVTGVIEDTEENEYSVNVKVRFDHPHQWGDDFYTEDWAWGRKSDEFGTLRRIGHGGASLTSSARCAICGCWRTSRTFRP